MNPHDERHLETAVDRELKALPHLRAPRTLLPRVRAAIEQRAASSWYHRAWQTWPPALQAVSMLALLAAFAGLCYGSWQLVHTPAFAAVTTEVGGWFGALGAVWKSLGVLAGAGAVVLRSLNPVVLISCGISLLLGYALCVGLGTLYVRLAFARR